jgi:hypothetical protein
MQYFIPWHTEEFRIPADVWGFGYSVTNTGDFVILETKARNVSLLRKHCMYLNYIAHTAKQPVSAVSEKCSIGGSFLSITYVCPYLMVFHNAVWVYKCKHVMTEIWRITLFSWPNSLVVDPRERLYGMNFILRLPLICQRSITGNVCS